MKSLRELIPLLDKPLKIVAVTHYKPDGDAVGSILALTRYLEKKGHSVTAVVPSEVPHFLQWLPGAGTVVNYEEAPAAVQAALSGADLVFCLDLNDFSRTRTMEEHLKQLTCPLILIDHHLYPAPVWNYGESAPGKSSTCEMVYDFIVLNEDESLIDKDIASCLYTGVMTDTGSFRFPATTASVHEMIAVLKHKGLEHSYIHDHISDSWSYNRLKFVGFMLLERMEIFPQWNAGLIAISRKDFSDYNLGSGDTEGLVNYPLSIAGIRFATLITEKADDVRLSFRSKGDFNVNEFAREYFNGGGHFNASGGRSADSFSDTILRFKKILSDIHPR